MGERRFVAEVTASGLVLGETETHHARHVLRLRPGAAIVCFDGHGSAWQGRISAYEAGRALVEVLAALPDEPEPLPVIRLACALLKGDKMDLVVQKATELGASSVVPIISERSEPRGDFSKRVARWGRIALDAAKQCERNRLLEVVPPEPLSSALERLDGTSIAFVERGSPTLHATLDVLRAAPPDRLTLYVGPEGGWSDVERAAFEGAGVASVSLGVRILRAETAAVAALAIVTFAVDRSGRR
jgi:16S rRNA (uracil1498-N3)-methyltransferase